MTIVMDRREIIAGLAAGTVVALSGCTTNPDTGRQQLMLISDDQLAQMSAGAWSEIQQKERFVKSPATRRRLDSIGSKIVSAAGNPNKNWEFHAIDSEQVNAFVLPGGQVAFYQGILDIMDNDDQVATVMGHEVGHVVGRHAAERASQQIVATAGITAANIALATTDIEHKGTIAAVLGAGVTFGVILPYSRAHEYEADRLGVRYMANANYRPAEALTFWDRMAKKGGNTAEFMSTHPSDANRIAAMRREIASFGA